MTPDLHASWADVDYSLAALRISLQRLMEKYPPGQVPVGLGAFHTRVEALHNWYTIALGEASGSK